MLRPLPTTKGTALVPVCFEPAFVLRRMLFPLDCKGTAALTLPTGACKVVTLKEVLAIGSVPHLVPN
jgi:hypothetical protein